MTAEERKQQVERVAKAICAAKHTYGGMVIEKTWRAMLEHERDHYRRMAQAAIEAMKD